MLKIASAIVYEPLSLIGIKIENFEKLSIIINRWRFSSFVKVNSRARSILIVWNGWWPLLVGV